MYIKSFRLFNVLRILVILLPIAFCVTQLEFIGEKLKEKMNVEVAVEEIEESYQWTDTYNKTNDDFAYAMDRFPSFYFEFLDFIQDPIIGYGGNVQDSFFAKNYTDAIGFTGGLMTLFAKHGFFIAVFLLYVLSKASFAYAKDMYSEKRNGLLLCFLVSMISYPLIWFPLYTAFWFYGYFQDSEINEEDSYTINGV